MKKTIIALVLIVTAASLAMTSTANAQRIGIRVGGWGGWGVGWGGRAWGGYGYWPSFYGYYGYPYAAYYGYPYAYYGYPYAYSYPYPVATGAAYVAPVSQPVVAQQPAYYYNAPAQQPAPAQTQPQQPPIINNYYGNGATSNATNTPMGQANALFGR